MRLKVRWLLARPRWIAAALLAALVLLYAGWLTYVIIADRPLDFYVYYIAGETFARGGNAYTISDAEWDALAADLGITRYATPYRYPPHTAALLILLRPLGPQGTLVVWLIASAAAMIGGAWLLGRSLGGRWPLVALAALLLSVPPLATLNAGQINGLLFLCVALALWGLVRRREGWLGGALALGAALKVIPLALIFYLFWRRRWRAGLIALGVLSALTLACLPLIGWPGLVEYVRNAIFLGRPDMVNVTPPNQTLTALLGRVFPASPGLALTSGRWLGLLFVVVTALLCWPVKGTDRLMPLEFGAIVAVLQLLPPFCYYHQFVLLLIPLLIMMERLWTARRWGWLGLLAALFVLTDLHGLTWHYIQQWPWLTLFPFLLGLTLWVMLAWLLLRDKRHVAP